MAKKTTKAPSVQDHDCIILTPVDVPCPTCGVEPRHPCQQASRTGNMFEMKRVHAARQKAFEVEAAATPAPEPAPVAKRVYKRAARATQQPETARSGRFELATYGKGEGETLYAKRPDATLRAILGIKWVELWELGISQKKASELLKALDAGETTVAAIIEPLGFEVGE